MSNDLIPRILLTGFKPFGKAEINPTEWLMEAMAETELAGAAVRAVVLDVDYERCQEQLRREVDDFQPAAIVSFGLRMSSDLIGLERVAVNVDDASIPDTGNQLRRGTRIVETGPVGYWSTLPLNEMLAVLREAGIGAEISNHAGTYVCNHLFYYARHLVEERGLGVPVGFIHVPPLPQQLPENAPSRPGPPRTGLAADTLLQVARLCVGVVAGALSYLSKSSASSA